MGGVGAKTAEFALGGDRVDCFEDAHMAEMLRNSVRGDELDLAVPSGLMMDERSEMMALER